MRTTTGSKYQRFIRNVLFGGAALLAAGRHIGHVHFADSNRQAMGFGHTDAAAVITALREINYTGYLSAEILPFPDPETAARQSFSAIYSLLKS